jgi:hypothetical protein
MKYVLLCKSSLAKTEDEYPLMVISSYLKRRIPSIQFDQQITGVYLSPILSRIKFLN